MTATDGEAVDGSDHRLRHVADHPVQGVDLEQTAVRRAVITGLGALLLIPAGAEGLLSGTGQADRAYLGTAPSQLERLDELVDGLRTEGVVAFRPVDGDPRQAVINLVGDIGKLSHAVALRLWKPALKLALVRDGV